MKTKTLGVKMVSGGILVVLIPLLTVGIFSSWKSYQALGNAAKEQSAHLAKSLAGALQTEMTDQFNIIKTLAVAISGSADLAAVTRKLEAARAAMGDAAYESFLFIDDQGIVAADSIGGKAKGINMSGRAYFIEAKKGKATLGDVVKSNVTGFPIAVLAVPILSDKGSLAGILAAGIKVDYLTQQLAAVKLGKTGYAYATNQKGIIIAHPKNEYILTMNLSEQEGMKEFMGKMLAGQSGSDFYTFKGVDKVAGYAPAPAANWYVALTQDQDELLGGAYQIRNFILILGLLDSQMQTPKDQVHILQSRLILSGWL